METSIKTSQREEQYYALSKQWLADLEFFKIETAFFHRLIDDHFAELSKQENLGKFKEIGHKLYGLERDESELNRLLDKHMKELVAAIEHQNAESNAQLSDKHAEIENLTSKLVKEYRDVKTELFSMIEQMISKKH